MLYARNCDDESRPDYSETFELELGTATGGGDAARLWIDGLVVIDGFERGGMSYDWGGAVDGLGGGGRGYVNLSADTLHEIIIEYRCEHRLYGVGEDAGKKGVELDMPQPWGS